MLIFKCALIALSSTYVLSICLQIVKETTSLDTGLAFLYIASGALELIQLWVLCPYLIVFAKQCSRQASVGAGKIIYDRYQQIHVLGSLTPNPNVTSFANRISSFSAGFLALGFLVYLFLFLFKVKHSEVDNNCLMALTIFIYGFGTLYLWVQCIISTYISTLYYEKNVLVLRQCLANVSFLVLVLMAIFGTVTSLLPGVNSIGLYICFVITSLCSYMLAAMFCIFILTFEKDYVYFSEGLRSDMLIDDACSLNNASNEDENTLFGVQEVVSNTRVKKGITKCAMFS